MKHKVLIHATEVNTYEVLFDASNDASNAELKRMAYYVFLQGADQGKVRHIEGCSREMNAEVLWEDKK